MIIAAGLDHSVNHSALVVVRGEHREHVEIAYTAFLAESPGDAKRWSKVGSCLSASVRNEKDSAVKAIARLCELSDWTSHVLLGAQVATGVEHIAIEDYAYGKTQKAHQIGEAGGTARLAAYKMGLRIRLHDPASVKLFGGASGNAKTAIAVIDFQRKYLTVDFTKAGKAAGDLWHAYVLARMCWTELAVRAGTVKLDELPAEERRVFLRVTKTYTTNLLDRPWAALPALEGNNEHNGV